MLHDSPAKRHARRFQLMIGFISLSMFIVFPVAIVTRELGLTLSPLLLVPYFSIVFVGFFWVNSIKCPSCGTLLCSADLILQSQPIKSHCPSCGRSSTAPYEP